jgi:outer membrane scaffolding protein for murein synthesis (MipA/OmpV family)
VNNIGVCEDRFAALKSARFAGQNLVIALVVWLGVIASPAAAASELTPQMLADERSSRLITTTLTTQVSATPSASGTAPALATTLASATAPAIGTTLASATPPVLTASPAPATSPVSTAPSGAPLWEIGGFALGVSQQAYPGADQQVDRLLPLPFVIYRGRFLRADRETTGLRAIKTPRYEIDVGAAASFAARSTEVDARRGMPELGTLIEFGPRLKVNLGDGPGGGRWRLDLPVRGVFDLSDGGAYRGMAFEPRLLWQQQVSPQFAYSASLGTIVGNKPLARIFYGVDNTYALISRPAYAAEGGLIAWRFATSLNYSLSREWRLFGFGRVDTVAGAANEDSPLVRQTTGVSAGFGVFYTWLRSERGAED